MQAKTVIFDANRPAAQQITLPLDSDCTVGVKVYKNGEEINDGISIGEDTGKAGPNGWRLYSLTTDGEEGTKKINVAVDKQPTVYAELDTSKTMTGTASPVPAPISKSFDLINFPQELPELVGKTIYFKDLSLDIAATVTDARGTTYPVFTFTNRLIYATSTDYYYIIDNGFLYKDGTFYQSITLGEDSKFVATTKVQQNYSVVFDIDFKVDSKDGLMASFPLYVQQKDLGYIEAVQQSGIVGSGFLDFSQLSAVPCASVGMSIIDNAADYKIIVADELYNDWKSSPFWGRLGAHMIRASEYLVIMTPYGGQDNMDEYSTNEVAE